MSTELYATHRLCDQIKTGRCNPARVTTYVVSIESPTSEGKHEDRPRRLPGPSLSSPRPRRRPAASRQGRRDLRRVEGPRVSRLHRGGRGEREDPALPGLWHGRPGA